MGNSQGIKVPVRWVLGRVAEVRVMHIQLLSSDQTEYEEHISGKGDDLKTQLDSGPRTKDHSQDQGSRTRIKTKDQEPESGSAVDYLHQSMSAQCTLYTIGILIKDQRS